MLSLRLLALLTVTGGLTHVAPREHDEFSRIAWAADYQAALTQAKAQHKPMLVVMVAGARDGEC